MPWWDSDEDRLRRQREAEIRTLVEKITCEICGALPGDSCLRTLEDGKIEEREPHVWRKRRSELLAKEHTNKPSPSRPEGCR